MQQTEKEFIAFRSRCMDARHVWNIHQTLFDDRESVKVLSDIAGPFFADLQQIIIRHLLLEVCALNDPAKQRSSNNLTVRRISALVANHVEHSERIGDLAKNTRNFLKRTALLP